MPYEKQKKWKWPEILPQEDKLHRRIRIHIEEEEECSVEEDGLMQSKSVNQHLRVQTQQMATQQTSGYSSCGKQKPNAIIVAGMDISTGNVPLHHDQEIEVEDKTVVVG